MATREVRISPDGDAIAIKSQHPDDSPAGGFGVMHSRHGGHWENNPDRLADWDVVDIPERTPEATPETPVAESESVPAQSKGYGNGK